MPATKYSESWYYSERAQLLLDKRDERSERVNSHQASQASVVSDSLRAATPISHSAPEHAILCVSGWEISAPVDF